MSALADIVHGLKAKRSGAEYVARCPAHDDHNPSLGINESNGRVLVRCRAGCDQSAVIAALRERGLWPESERREHPQDWGTIVRTYDYTDERGALLYQVCRFEPKSFRPRRPDGGGGWRWGYGDVRRVLYRLPEVLEAPIVFFPEGEKDCEALREHGFVATTNAGGANAWRQEYAQYLAGREVILIPDDDGPGWNRVLRIARDLIGVAARILIQETPGAKDISEWFNQGHSELELLQQLEDHHACR